MKALVIIDMLEEEDALEYLRTVYGARITSVAELVGRPGAAGVGHEPGPL